MTILKIAWRNIWRNPIRSLVVIIAMFIGMVFGLFSSAFMSGWMQQRIKDGVETEISHIQIHQPDYKLNDDMSNYIPAAPVKGDSIRKLPAVNGVSARFKIQAMVASAETASGVMVYGVDAREESKVVNVHEKIIEGTWFENGKGNSVVVGAKLAKKLKIHLRSKIVLRMQDANGNITGGAFRVVGIYKTINTMFDETNVWVLNTDIARITGLPDDAAHEIAVHVSDQKELSHVLANIRSIYPNVKSEDWKEVSPELGYLTEMGNTYQYMMVIIILLALGFGIVNTMLMVVLERVRELGMLMAVGMTKMRVFIMIVLESIMLSCVGGFSGIVGGVLLTEYFGVKGIDLSLWGEGLEGMGFAPIVHPVYDLNTVIDISSLVIITGIAASIYPAYKALKLNPSQAIRVI